MKNLWNWLLTIPVWVYVILGIVLVASAVLLVWRSVNAYLAYKDREKGYTSHVVAMRGLLAAFCTAIAVFVLFTGCAAGDAFNNRTKVDPPTQGSQGQDPPPPVVDEPLPAVNLTEAQLKAFLEGYTLEFDDSSLTFGVGWRDGTPSRAEERIAAIKAAGGTHFEDGIAFPYEEALAVAEKWSKMSDEEKATFIKAFRHDLYQDIIANPVVGMAWLEMFAESDLILENNSDWILPNLEVLQSMYAGTYVQPKAGDPGYAEAMKVELNNIPNSTDVKARGLDLLLVYNGPKIEVRQSWARVGARICGVLEFFSVEGFTNRTSSMNFCLLPTAEDSMVRATKASYQESETAVLLVYGRKDGKEAIAYGMNIFDRRPEEFRVNVQEPVKTPPKNTDTPTTPPPTTPPPVTPPPVTPPPTQTEYGTLLIRYIDDSGRQMPGMTNHTEQLKVGAGYNVKSPVAPAGYALRDQSQSVVRSSRYGAMTKNGITIDVVYVAENFTVTLEYVYENGRTYAPSETYTVKVGTSYSYNAKPCLKYYWVDPEKYSGTMPARNLTLVFTYHYLYLEEWKDPNDGSAAQGNAPIGGGKNDTSGKGEFEETKTPPKDYPTQGSSGDPTGGRTDLDQNGNSTTPLKPSDQHESSGQGGGSVDHPVVDPNGGNTDNGTVADKNPIDVDPGTTVTNPTTGKDESTTSGSLSTAVPEPD